MTRKVMLIEELLRSQELYIGTLELIHEDIRKLASEAVGLEQANRLFNVEGLLQLNKQFLVQLEVASQQQVFNAPTLIPLIQCFRLYSQFLQNYTANEHRIRQLRGQNKKFESLLEEHEYSPRWKKLDIYGLYSQPFQRPGKYDLFFRELLKCEQKGTEGHANIQAIFTKFRQVNQQNDSSLGDVLNSYRLIQLDTEYGNIANHMAPMRKFIAEKRLEAVLGPVTGESKVFFFNNLLLVDIICNPEESIAVLFPMDHCFQYRLFEKKLHLTRNNLKIVLVHTEEEDTKHTVDMLDSICIRNRDKIVKRKDCAECRERQRQSDCLHQQISRLSEELKSLKSTLQAEWAIKGPGKEAEEFNKQSSQPSHLPVILQGDKWVQLAYQLASAPEFIYELHLRMTCLSDQPVLF